MNSTKLRRPRFRRGLRVEPLEARTLFHAGYFALADGILDIAPDHGNNAIRVEWNPASRSIGVFLNGQEQLRVAGSEVRALSLRGLQGNDVAYMDARLNLPVSYDRGGSQGVLRGQLSGYGDSDYYVATPGCEEFAFVCQTGEHTKPTQDTTVQPAADADAAVVRAVVGSHATHMMMAPGGMAGMNGDGAFTPLGNMETAYMSHRQASETGTPHEGGAAPLDLMTAGVTPKVWMPPG